MTDAWVTDNGFQQSLIKSANIHLKISAVVEQYSNLIADRIRASMAEPKHGTPYMYEGRVIVASAPGEAPAIKTSKLVSSIKVQTDTSGMSAEIGSFGVGYAAELEKGIGGLARPYVQPAFDRYRDGFIAAIRKAVLR